jgi:hypothetical protein
LVGSQSPVLLGIGQLTHANVVPRVSGDGCREHSLEHQQPPVADLAQQLEDDASGALLAEGRDRSPPRRPRRAALESRARMEDGAVVSA